MRNIEITDQELEIITKRISEIPDEAWKLYSETCISKFEEELEAKCYIKTEKEYYMQCIIISRENYTGISDNWKYKVQYYNGDNSSVIIKCENESWKDKFFGNRYKKLMLTLKTIFDTIYPIRIGELEYNRVSAMIKGLENIKKAYE